MCIVIDANFFSNLTADPTRPEFQQIVSWLERRGGRLVFGGRLADELRKNHNVARYLRQLTAAGRAEHIDDESVDEEELIVGAIGHISDDPHVLALARVSGARTLCSYDQELHTDFKNPVLIDKPRGAVYMTAAHAHLLRHLPRCA